MKYLSKLFLARVWRTGDSKDRFSVRNVLLKQAKIMSIAWHNTREGKY